MVVAHIRRMRTNPPHNNKCIVYPLSIYIGYKWSRRRSLFYKFFRFSFFLPPSLLSLGLSLVIEPVAVLWRYIHSTGMLRWTTNAIDANSPLPSIHLIWTGFVVETHMQWSVSQQAAIQYIHRAAANFNVDVALVHVFRSKDLFTLFAVTLLTNVYIEK